MIIDFGETKESPNHIQEGDLVDVYLSNSSEFDLIVLKTPAPLIKDDVWRFKRKNEANTSNIIYVKNYEKIVLLKKRSDISR